jgi:hypothetical protein
MLAFFCLRLALGLVAALLLLPSRQVNPRFYRTHFLVVLGLTAVAVIFLRHAAEWPLWTALVGSLLLAFLGSLLWSLDGAPAGRSVIVLAAAAQAASLVLAERTEMTPATSAGPVLPPLALLASSFTSAALLGAATSAMLLGHSYLIAPGMSIQPLLRLLIALGAALLLRMAVAGIALWCWTDDHSLANLKDETVLWLPLRWGLGLVAPLVLGWMAWQTARIRSTQSATGILYVVVIFCFLGELTAQLLLNTTRLTL